MINFAKMVEIYYQNVRGLKTKRVVLSENILQSSYNIIAFTETWLNSNIMDREIIDSRYTVYRKDRDLKTVKSKIDGGGVLIAVSKHIKSHRIKIWENDQETLWVLLKVIINKVVKKIALCVVYLPPPVSLKSLKNFLNSVGIVVDQGKAVIVLGDFNLGLSVQNQGITPRSQKLMCAFNDFISSTNLSQVNKINNCDGRLLDLIITNMANIQVNMCDHILCKLDEKHPNLLINL